MYTLDYCFYEYNKIKSVTIYGYENHNVVINDRQSCLLIDFERRGIHMVKTARPISHSIFKASLSSTIFHHLPVYTIFLAQSSRKEESIFCTDAYISAQQFICSSTFTNT